jgi:hypothetical protein
MSAKKLRARLKTYLPLAIVFLIGLGLFRIGQLLFAPAWLDDIVTPLFEGSSLLSACVAVCFFVVTLFDVAMQSTTSESSPEYQAYLRNSK